MKKLILFAAILFAGVSVVKAQKVASTDNTKLTVILERFQDIIVNHPTVILKYNSVKDYQDGVTVENADHLTVHSAGGFTVSVGAENLQSKLPTGGSIEASTINISANEGTKKTGKEVYTAQGIGTIAAPKTIITSTEGGIHLKYNVTYKGDGSYNYMDKHLNGTAATEYETTVVYTITAS